MKLYLKKVVSFKDKVDYNVPMKWILLLQFIFFSMFSIVQIDHEDLSGSSVTFLEKVEVSTPGIDNGSLKPIKDISFKYLDFSARFHIADDDKITLEFQSTELFKSFLLGTQLARSPPTLLS